MSRFLNKATGVTFSVDDSKDARYDGEGFEVAKAEKPAAKKAAAKSESK